MIKDLFCSLSWYFTVSLSAQSPAGGRASEFLKKKKGATHFVADYL